MSNLLDILDSNGKPLGIRKERNIIHKDGDWHSSIHLWVCCGDRALLQKRAKTKESFPGCYDASVAGHVDAGEECKKAALRECMEEIGIILNEKDVYEIGVLKLIIVHKDREFNSREFNHIYIVKFDVMPEVVFDKREVDEMKIMKISDVKDEILKGNPHYCISLEEIRLVKDYVSGIS